MLTPTRGRRDFIVGDFAFLRSKEAAMRKASLMAALAMMAAAGCAGQAGTDDGTSATTSAALSPGEQAGRDTWFKSTFGGQHFFTQILPGPPFNLTLGFDAILTSD